MLPDQQLMTTAFKSVHITNYYHKDSGGISTSYNNLLAAAERHRRHIRLIVPGERSAIESISDFAKIYYVPAGHSMLFDRRYRVIMPWRYMFDTASVSKILLDEKPDLIEVTDKYTLSLIGAMIRTNNFKALGRPMLVHFSCERMNDNIGTYVFNGTFGQRMSRFIIRNFTLPSFDFHIANSAYTAGEFFESIRGTGEEERSDSFFNFCWRFFKAPRVPIEDRIFVCPRGVDIAKYSPTRKSPAAREAMLKHAGVGKDAVILLYAGRIAPEKNIGLLVDLMKILKDDKGTAYYLLVAGDGPKTEWLKQQAESAAPHRIIQLGHLDKDILADYYANADVFVHPNPREPFGIAPLEAMASGIPTVAPNAGGVLSYATPNNAWLVETSAEDFAAAIREIVGNPELTRQKVANALETAALNTSQASTDKLIATYDEITIKFNADRALYTDREAARDFDYAGELLGDLQKPSPAIE